MPELSLARSGVIQMWSSLRRGRRPASRGRDSSTRCKLAFRYPARGGDDIDPDPRALRLDEPRGFCRRMAHDLEQRLL